LAFLNDWLASDPNRLDASLCDFLGAANYIGSAHGVEELRMLSGYDTTTGEGSQPR